MKGLKRLIRTFKKKVDGSFMPSGLGDAILGAHIELL
jgi:hypothetical protein